MEVDIEITLKKVPMNVASSIADRFDVEFATGGEADFVDIMVRPTSGNKEGVIDHVINEFLGDLSLISDAIKEHQGMLRLGVFYYIEESIVFPFQLSRETINLLSDLNLSIDATGYPCSSDE